MQDALFDHSAQMLSLHMCASNQVVRQEAADTPPVFVGGNDAQPIPDIVFLQVFLGQVLQIPAACTAHTDKMYLV